MLWFTFAWFYIEALVVVDAYNRNFAVKNGPSLCDTKNFLAEIDGSKKQYKVFDEGNLELPDGGLPWHQAEDICLNKTFCPHCLLPEPRNRDEDEVLVKLADHCRMSKLFLGLWWYKNKDSLIWRSDFAKVTFQIECDLSGDPSMNSTCVGMVDGEWCKIDCHYETTQSFICEMEAPPSPESDAEDLPVLTIVGIVVGSLVGLVVLGVLIAVCCKLNVCCCSSCGKRSNQNTENTAPNADQGQPVVGSEPQTLQSLGNFSQPPVAVPAGTQGQPGPVYIYEQPGPVYTQASTSPPAPANTGATQAAPGTTFIQMQPAPYYNTQMYPPPYYHEMYPYGQTSDCTVI